MMLTATELHIIKLVSQGYKNKEIGFEIGLSVSTVKNRIRFIFDKLGFSNRVELALWYVRHIEFSNKFSPAPVTGVFHGNEINLVGTSREKEILDART